MKKLNRIAILGIVLLIGVFSSCSDDRTERGRLDFETGNPLPRTDRYGGVDLYFDLRDSDIETNSRWNDDIVDIDLYNTRLIVESRDIRRNDYLTITFDDGRIAPFRINTRPNTSDGLIIDGLEMDRNLCNYMDDVVRRLVGRGRIEFRVTVIIEDEHGYAKSNAEVFFRMENDLDIRVRD